MPRFGPREYICVKILEGIHLSQLPPLEATLKEEFPAASGVTLSITSQSEHQRCATGALLGIRASRADSCQGFQWVRVHSFPQGTKAFHPKASKSLLSSRFTYYY